MISIRTFFNLGLLISVIIGAGAAIEAPWAEAVWPLLVLIALGVIVGYRIQEKHAHEFLVGMLALVLANAAAKLYLLDLVIPRVGIFITSALGHFSQMVGVAAVIVAFGAFYRAVK